MIYLRINPETRSYMIMKLWSYIPKNVKQAVVISKILPTGAGRLRKNHRSMKGTNKKRERCLTKRAEKHKKRKKRKEETTDLIPLHSPHIAPRT